MNILLTNDDGIFAEGIRKLAEELEKYHNVIIIAPNEENSAKSHSITILEELVVKEEKLYNIRSKAYSVTGTPADCIRIAMDQLVDKESIDMVVSGINKGLNAGMDILYSGTVSAAIEGSIQNLPSIAISAEYRENFCNFKDAIKESIKIIELIEKKKILSSKLLLNLNVPIEKKFDNIKVCRLGETVYDYYKINGNEGLKKSFKIIGREDKKFEKGTDRYYLSLGYSTVTPLDYNMTNFKELEKLRNIKF